LRGGRHHGPCRPPVPRRGPVPWGAPTQPCIAIGDTSSAERPGERSASKRTDVGLCPGAYSLPMDANVHEGERLTAHAAVAEIRRIEGLHGALARRASGLTWMIWGIVAPAIFVSYALLGILVGFPSDGDGYHALRFLFPALWAPWAAIGLVATATLWRSVGLVISLLFGGDIRQARQWFTLIVPLTSGLVLFGGGLYLTSRA